MKVLQLNDDIGSPYAILLEGHLELDRLVEVLDRENDAWGEAGYLPERARFEHAIPTGDEMRPWLLHRKASTQHAKPVTLVYYIRPMPPLEAGEET